jgi:hypothetical protein
MAEEQEVQSEAPTQEEGLPPAEERDFVVAEDLEQPSNDRPEWLPEKYKTGEDLAKAYKELESKLGTKEEDFRAKFMEEIQSEAFKDRPETAGDYQLPDFVDQEQAVDNDLLRWWSEHSFENGYSQDEFQKGLEMYMQASMADVPDSEAEMQKLGDNANARVEAAALFANQFFTEEHMPSIERLTETADGLQALEFIMEKMKSPSVNVDSNPVGQVTEEGLRAMMEDERYWHPARRNNDYIKEVNDGFQKLYSGRS